MRTFLGWTGFHWITVLAGVMSLLVMVDAFVGHYRSGFTTRAQYAPFVSGGAIVVAVVLTVALPRAGWAQQSLFVTGIAAVVTGVIGAAFHHHFGILRKPGGYGWLLHHLMYHAPPLAPLALSGVGALAMVGARGMLGRGQLLGIDLRVAALITVALALVGAAMQAAVLHYRGAFNNGFMYLPLTTPLLAAAAVPWLVLARGPAPRLTVTALLVATFLVGFIGLGMHLRGFDRMMGGLRVALPNVLDGPAVAAPALFSGYAAAGLAAVHLL